MCILKELPYQFNSVILMYINIVELKFVRCKECLKSHAFVNSKNNARKSFFTSHFNFNLV